MSQNGPVGTNEYGLPPLVYIAIRTIIRSIAPCILVFFLVAYVIDEVFDLPSSIGTNLIGFAVFIPLTIAIIFINYSRVKRGKSSIMLVVRLLFYASLSVISKTAVLLIGLPLTIGLLLYSVLVKYKPIIRVSDYSNWANYLA